MSIYVNVNRYRMVGGKQVFQGREKMVLDAPHQQVRMDDGCAAEGPVVLYVRCDEDVIGISVDAIKKAIGEAKQASRVFTPPKQEVTRPADEPLH